jgi:flagellar secretion chaperone FliS
MAASPSAFGQYRQVQVKSASPGKLIVLLYQGAIRAMKQGIDLTKKKDYEGKGNALIKAQDIVMELNMALDMDIGGPISHSLRQLYIYIYKRLLDANMQLNTDYIHECIGIMENLLGAWEMAVQETEGAALGAPKAGLSVTG